MATIYDEFGSQSILGTNGVDVIYGGTSASPLLDTGDDNLNGSGGPDTLYGGDGNDTLTGADTNHTVYPDSLIGGTGDDTYLLNDRYYDYVVELVGEGTDTVVSEYVYTLGANLENLTLLNPGYAPGTATWSGTGNELDNLIIGGVDTLNSLAGELGNDTLQGGIFDDTLNGGAGDDSLVGDAGNDTYVVDALTDQLVETFNAGSDTVQTSLSWTLAVNFENLLLSGTLNIDGTGNAHDNLITGTSGNNSLIGLDGNDWLEGGGGDDTLIGGAGDDTLKGGAGTDSVDGGDGSDTLSFADSTVALTINLAIGSGPEVYTGIENLIGSGGKDKLTGDAGDNNLSGGFGVDTLIGGDGNDTLAGGAGIDSLVGGLGDDTYFFSFYDNFDDLLIENPDEGIDTVITEWAFPSWTLAENIENLILPGGHTGIGNSLNNLISSYPSSSTQYGMAGDDTLRGGKFIDSLDGGSGNDSLEGGKGDDRYVVDSNADVILELVDEGNDFVTASASWTMSANVESLTLTGSAKIDATGNELDNTLTGNSGTNSINGAAGNDLLIANGGDTLDGGADTDTVSYATKTTAVTVNLATGNGTDTVLNVENVIGGNGSDTIDGNSGDNLINGGTSADLLSGGDGDDTYVVTFGDVITELANEGDDEVLAANAWTLAANIERLTLTGINSINGTGNELDNLITGNTGDNRLLGGSGNDLLLGDSGNDTLRGEGGTDTAVGGSGDDEYTVDSIADVVTEDPGAGIDTVLASASWTMSDNIEFLTLTGTAAINGTGNVLANKLTGNTKANLLSGAGGNDTLIASAGGDTLDGGADTDTVSYVNFASGIVANLQTGSGNDSYLNVENLLGGSGNDTLTGNNENNRLDGGAGADGMTGGLGNDTYVADSVDDLVLELANEGNDTLETHLAWTLSAALENLLLTGAAHVNGTGNAAANYLTGNIGDNSLAGGDGADTLQGSDGNDTLQGNAGIDSLSGGAGNDVYIIDSNSTDVLTELTDQGTDTVLSAFTYTLKDNFENLTLTGTGNTNGNGNALANVITGNTGNNRLTGGAGADTLVGGSGNDTYVVLADGDVIQEDANGGIDTVQATSYNLGASGNVENLALTGTGGSGTGNTLDNSILGNSGRNELDGAEGNDTLTGKAGNDVYYVDSTGDVVVEVAGEGNDQIYSSVSYSATANVETLWLTGNGLTGTGSSGNDNMHAGSGDSLLVGGAGNDSLHGVNGDMLTGNAGDDRYYIDDSTEATLIELTGEGVDTVYFTGDSFLGYVLAENVENLVLQDNFFASASGNAGNNTITGNYGDNFAGGGAGNDSLIGGEGNDTLDGGSGNDTMSGGEGADTFVVDSAGDFVKDNGTSTWAQDTVQSFVSWKLAASLENLTGLGNASLSLKGNELDNVITANDAGNFLYGYGGVDELIGGNGNDSLAGGKNGAIMTGGAGGDWFIFDQAATTTNLPDQSDHICQIVDFSHDQVNEEIRLYTSVFTSLTAGKLNAGSFVLGSFALDADDHILYDANGFLYYDADGSGSGEALAFAYLQNGEGITAADIRIV